MHHRGFSLVELMVVVAIIAALSSVALVFLNTARERSRDARRMSDMRTIQNTLGLYQASNGGIYPTSSLITINGEDSLSIVLENDGLITDMPVDPMHPQVVYRYAATSSTGYGLYFCLETDQYENIGFTQGCTNSVIQ